MKFEVDVYSVGVLLFQMLIGVLPFVAEEPRDWMYYHVVEPPPLHLLDELAPDIRDIVARMLSKKAPTRPSEPGALKKTIDAVIS